MKRPFGYYLAILAAMNVLWAASFPIAKRFAFPSLSPLMTVQARFTLAALVMLALCKWLRPAFPQGRDRVSASLLGMLGMGLTYALYFVGLGRTSAIEASILIALSPFAYAIVARLFLGETFAPIKTIGILLGFVGAYVVAAGGWVVPNLDQGTTAGDLIVVLAVFVEAFSVVLAKPIVERCSGPGLATWEMVSTAIVLTPFGLWQQFGSGWRADAGFDLGAVAFGVGYLALVSSVLGYTVWYSVMRVAPAGAMGAAMFAQTPSGVLFGAWLLGERLDWATGIGAAIIVASIALVAFEPKRLSITAAPPREAVEESG